MNGGPEPYPLTLQIVKYSKDDKGKFEEGEYDEALIKEATKEDGWSIETPSNVLIPSTPGTCQITIGWSTYMNETKNEEERKKKEIKTILTKEEYQKHLQIMNNTASLSQKKNNDKNQYNFCLKLLVSTISNDHLTTYWLC